MLCQLFQDLGSTKLKFSPYNSILPTVYTHSLSLSSANGCALFTVPMTFKLLHNKCLHDCLSWLDRTRKEYRQSDQRQRSLELTGREERVQTRLDGRQSDAAGLQRLGAHEEVRRSFQVDELSTTSLLPTAGAHFLVEALSLDQSGKKASRGQLCRWPFPPRRPHASPPPAVFGPEGLTTQLS